MAFQAGHTPFNKGKAMSEKTKQKLREKAIGRMAGEKNPMHGRTHTKEAIAKIIDANIGRKASEETRQKMSEAHRELKPSDWGAGFKQGNIPWNKAAWKNAYFAGLIDGEGSLGIVIGSKTNSKVYRKVVCRVQMVDGLGVLEEGQKIWGGWIYKRERSKKNVKWQDSYDWSLQNGNVDKFLKDILPYLRIKKRQAEIVLEYRSLQRKKRTIASGGTGLFQIPEKELEYRKKLETELKSLKLNKGIHTAHDNIKE